MSKPRLRLRDWLFGAGGKRRLLEAALANPGRTWTQAELARASDVHAKGSVDEHVRALVQLGLLNEVNGRFRLAQRHPLVKPLGSVLAALSSIQDAELERPP
jgi:hypothetical protein